MLRIRRAVLALFLLLPATLAHADSMSLYNQANDAYRADDFPKTIALSNQALLEPDVPGGLASGILNLRATAELRLGQLDAAIQDFDRALVLLQEAVKTEPQLAEFIPDTYWSRGLAKIHNNQCADAIVDFTAAIAAKPDFASALAERGRCHATLGERDAAIADLDAAIKLDPTDEDARQWRAELK